MIRRVFLTPACKEGKKNYARWLAIPKNGHHGTLELTQVLPLFLALSLIPLSLAVCL